MTNIPTLPPTFLERCLAFSERLFAMKSGSGKLEVSPSHFLFEVDHPPGKKESGHPDSNSDLQTGSSSRYTSQKMKKKKKTPSDLRRDARRRDKHLENKRNLSPPSSSSNQPSSNDPQNSADLSNLSLISETPMIVENSEDTNTASSEEIPESENPENNVHQVPVITKTSVIENRVESKNKTSVMIARNDNPVIVNELTHNPDSDMLSDLPPVISPISTPSPRKSQTLPNTSPTPKIEEVILILCAKNQATAVKYGKKFPKSSFLKPNDYYKTNHFEFSAKLNESNLSKINEIVKLPKKVQLHAFKVVSENMWYFFSDEQELIPVNEEPTYCPECQECASL